MRGIESLFLNSLICVGGIGLLVVSAEWVVEKMIKIAHFFKVSDTFVGLTVLSIGTSLPEIGSHIIASIGILNGHLDYEIASSTVLGANIGSNVVQQTFIIGLVTILVGTLKFKKQFMAENYVAMVVTMMIVWILGYDGLFSRTDSIVLLLLFVLYLYFLYNQEQQHSHHAEATQHPSGHIAWEVFLLLIGMGLLLGSSAVTLESVQFIVNTTGISGSLIGVVSLGIASALPEMITAISGVKKKAKGISVGTLIGSNIVNPLVAIGIGGTISTYYVPAPLKMWDLPMQIITAFILLRWLSKHDRKLNRKGGVMLMIIYLLYLFIRMQYFNID